MFRVSDYVPDMFATNPCDEFISGFEHVLFYLISFLWKEAWGQGVDEVSQITEKRLVLMKSFLS